MQITVYTKPNCPQCVKAKQLLQDRGVSFSEIAIGTDVDAGYLMEQYPQARSAPVITIDGLYIGGYMELLEELDTGPGGALICG